MKALLLAICVCLGVWGVSLATAGERLYDFRDDSAWEVISADWKIEDGAFVTTGSTNTEIALAVLRSEEGVDTLDVEQIEVRAYDLGSGAWQNVFVVFGFDEAEPLAYLGGAFVGGAQEWRVETFDAETRGGRSEVAGVADVLSPEIWYTLQIVFDGDDVIVNGAEEGDPLEERVRYTFPNGKPSGLVGLGCSQAESKFDDFRVQGASIASLAVEPVAKLATQWSALKLDTIR